MLFFHSSPARRDNDHYPTPKEATAGLARMYRDIMPKVILEPACGRGTMSRYLETEMPEKKIISSDLVGRGFGFPFVDFMDVPLLYGNFGIITNPPFSLASQFITHSHKIGSSFTALLLKANYFNVGRNAKLWHMYPPKAQHPLTWRVDFTGDGSPVMDCTWYVWGPRVPVSTEPMGKPKC